MEKNPDSHTHQKQKTIGAQAIDLIQRYGYDNLHQYLVDLIQITDQIGMLNETLAQLDLKKQEKKYTEIVDSVISATQQYYTYMAKLPTDIRTLFLTIVGNSNQDEQTIDQLRSQLDVSLLQNAGALLAVQSIRPRAFIMQIDAITNQLTTLSGEQKLKVGSRGKQPVKTAVTLDIPEHMKIEGGSALTTYDKSIINGVTSLLESGNTVFSIPMLYHAMTGKQNPTIDEQLLDEISGKLERMRRLMLTIDLTEESRAQYLKKETGEPLDIEELSIEGYLLPLNKLTGVVNGKKTELYQLLQPPPLYTYSKLKQQLASVPIQLLNAPINNNSTTIPLKTYLLQRIELMRNQKNSVKSHIILYDTIYSELGEQNANKTKKMRIRTYTEKILAYFIEQKYISNYEILKKGRAVAGIKISL